MSDNGEITRRVLQETVLGPLCFLILINSINDKDISAFLSSFADDTKLGLGIESVDDAMKLQESLEAMYEWQSENNMEFNATKFQVLQFGKKDTKLNYNYMTPEAGGPIIPSNTVKDLGIYIDDDFTYKSHINEICKKVKKRIGWILRAFKTRDKDFMRHVWRVYILPIIDYCSQLWTPRNSGLLTKLGKLQKIF